MDPVPLWPSSSLLFFRLLDGGPRCVVIYSSHVVPSTSTTLDSTRRRTTSPLLKDTWEPNSRQSGGRAVVVRRCPFPTKLQKRSPHPWIASSAVFALCEVKIGAIAFFPPSHSLLGLLAAVHPPLHFPGLFDFRRSTSASALQLLFFRRGKSSECVRETEDPSDRDIFGRDEDEHSMDRAILLAIYTPLPFFLIYLCGRTLCGPR